MADFRKWLYALAGVALLSGLSAPAHAQTTNQQPFICQANAGVPPIVRAESYADLVGDFVLACTGGDPTPAGTSVPQVNITVLLSTNITSRLLAGNFNEALLIIDEPNSAVNPTRPIMNCGQAGAPDNSVSGLGVCGIVSTGDPAQTYDGTPNGWWTQNDAGQLQVCDGTDPDGGGPLPARPAAGTFACGRPNVFQGQTGVAQNAGQANSVVFLGVPLDPPGENYTRILRITNIRADAELTGVSSTFTTSPIQMSVSINGNTSLAVNNPQQIVAFVQRGLRAPAVKGGFDFIQCSSLNVLGANDSLPSVFGTGSVRAVNGAMWIRFAEGFASSWKAKGFEHIIVNGNFNGSYYQYLPPTGIPSEIYPTVQVRQNVPGAIYNTESGFTSGPAQGLTSPNPADGIGTIKVTGGGVLVHRAGIGAGTAIDSAGIATQGTRLQLIISSIPNGVRVYVPSSVFLTRDSSTTITGLAVRTVTTSNGAGAFTRYDPTNVSGSWNFWTPLGSDNNAVYEVIFADPFALEDMTIPIVIAYTANLAQNLPDPTVTAQVAGGFAPWYEPSSSPSPRAPSASLPVPRFIPGSAPVDLFRINKCACNLLFPFVSNAKIGDTQFDTGIAIANTSRDPGAAFGYLARQQQGSVQLWYYNSNPGVTPVPTQCTNASSPGTCPGTTLVPSGGVMTYVLSAGSADWGLDPRGAGFTGYMIAQAQFQYCHAFAYITANNAGPLQQSTAMGYLALVLDKGARLARTAQLADDALDN